MSQYVEKITDAKEIWNWAKDLTNLRKLNDLSKQQLALIKMCKENLPSDFNENKYCFPSKITEDFALQYIDFSLLESNNFKFKDILNKIWNNEQCINKESINALLIMLIDIALYRAFVILKNLSHGRFFYQLNMCIIWDAMIIKPDKDVEPDLNIGSLLDEVSEKAKLRINGLNTNTIWTLAMLNYKVHLYDFSIPFFKEYITKNSKSKNPSIQLRIYHARIYIGYCYEKSEKFDKAIDIFKNTLSELESKAKTSEKYKNLIRELNHGLGHFYNERAVFGKASEQSEDIISKDILNARYHLVDALSKKVDYYSCYGSLFHEYGDYKTAQSIYNEASQNSEIIANSELLNELQFYIAQTDASLAANEDEQIKQAEDNFKKFEDYCRKTFNYDGIVHARIFKIRTFLRKIYFSTNNCKYRERVIDLLDDWYRELMEYSLSSYASKSIKKEYDKIRCILNFFMSLYADDSFEWHTEDLQFNLQKFMSFMPKNVLNLDYSPKNTSNKESNLYQIAFGDLWVWCVGSKLLANKQLRKILETYGNNTKNIISISEKNAAHSCIQKNRKPDLVVLMPPDNKDSGFENELSEIKTSLTELYFVYCPNPKGFYNNEWFETNISGQGKKFTSYPACSIAEALSHAFCLRTFEVLRKELLNPIPLFSLAPTHFSASYDFQLGEPLDILFELLSEHNNDSKILRGSLSFIDNKYSNDWLNRMTFKTKIFTDINECASGIMHICCPAPSPDVDNYIEYSVNDKSALQALHFPHDVMNGEHYIIKALPSYKNIFWDLEEAIRNNGNSCDHDKSDMCTVFIGNNLLSTDKSGKILNLCRSILSMIFNKDIQDNSVINKPFKCILKKIKNMDSPKECVIHIILSEYYDSKNDTFCCPLRSETEMKKEAPTVFVTYSWEEPNDTADSNMYLREVLDFVRKLRENGYNATLDLDMYKNTHNWTDIMIQGLQMDKVIVLLSEEYKRKADDWAKEAGVKFESRELVERFKRDRQNIILAKLSSKKDINNDQLRPICFSGENVIDLSSSELTNGYNLLWLSLDNQSLTGDLPPVNPKITTGRTI